MPELPEMQALAERLQAAVGGQAFRALTPIQFSGLKTFVVDPSSLVGRTLDAVGRRGKFLVLDVDGGNRVLVHLSQGGRVDVEAPPKTTRPKFGVVRFLFNSAAVLVKEFGTERKAGWWVLGPGDEGPLERLGPDPFSDEFEELVTGTDDRRRVHTLLRHQGTVAGIGRGYTDDILHRARLSPYASLPSLTPAQRHGLVEATRAVLTEGTEAERQRTGGLPTKIGDHFTVHGRHGEPCPTCGTDLRRVSYESYEVTYCPKCQNGGKVLADRRMSRLVR